MDMRRDIAIALEEVVDFLWPTGSAALPSMRFVRQMPHSECELSVVLYNYNELECIFKSTPLRWIIYEREKIAGFEDVMTTGDEFVVWAEDAKNTNDDIMNPSKCRVSVDHGMLEKYMMKVTKSMSRCGHGGHTEKCRGYGLMKDYMCTQLLKLSRYSCDSMTYSSGECYLHDETMSDFWDGDCNNELDYWAYPGDDSALS
mmetsp:Transcript_19826/g.28513  ORF Transcript_19826/g.28513 Transcript_19826/m.28513 type:complete len:201 (-) Transcript_19826:150-752(-)